jgi:tRNA nucleotidyltransferase/poly(A) polymerase
MKLRELLQQIKKVQEEIHASEPFICGGTCRDKYMNKPGNVDDIDITTGDRTAENISLKFYEEFSKKYNIIRRIMDDHSSIFIGNLKLDFSSNFILPDIDKYIKIKNPTSLQKEIYSRDFTCNSLLLTFDLKQILDPIGNGFKDIDNKIIKTCLKPDITLVSNRNRVIRAIYLAIKLDFNIDPLIIDYVRKNPNSVRVATEKTLNQKLDFIFKKDPEKASYYLTEMGIWNYVPITKLMYPYYKQSL